MQDNVAELARLIEELCSPGELARLRMGNFTMAATAQVNAVSAVQPATDGDPAIYLRGWKEGYAAGETMARLKMEDAKCSGPTEIKSPEAKNADSLPDRKPARSPRNRTK